MYSVAIVTAFSENGYPLLRQFLTSCDRCACTEDESMEFTAFCYECNWKIKPFLITPFERKIDVKNDLPLKRIKIVQKDASGIELKHTILPDMAVYDDFARNHLGNFEYVLFCHDDIHFNDCMIFSSAIKMLRDNRYNIIAEPKMGCDDNLSMRYRPHFIFVHSEKFKHSNLSFANEYSLFNPDFKITPSKSDGGAGLLFSQFHKDNPTEYSATNFIPESWVRHIRLDFCEMGIETYNITHPNTKEFHEIAEQANKFADQYLYG